MTGKPTLRLIHSDELTGVEEQDLIAYINFADGIRCNLGVAISAIENYGAMGIGSGSDPEDAMVRAIDRKTTFRRSHQVMLAIADHARVLTNALLIAQFPAYVASVFGKLAGVVIWKSDDHEALSDLCKRFKMGSATKEDKARVGDMRVRAQEMYNRAVRAYATVLRALPERYVVKADAVQERRSPAHECREGGSVQTEWHKCPCPGDAS